MNFEYSDTFANESDNDDALSALKEKFNFPLLKPIYLCGHSLGLQPKSAKKFVQMELDAWS